jgi:hypothetical protein
VRSFVKTHGEVINGDEAQLLEIAKLRTHTSKLKELLNHWLHLSNVCDDNLAQLAVETASVLNEVAVTEQVQKTDAGGGSKDDQ